jgi:fructose-1,6-bisphosphatase I
VGSRQVAAGYLVYGPATVFVYAAGAGVHAFVQDPADGHFRLTRACVRTPAAGRTYAVNDANWPRWGPAPRALVERFRAAPGPTRYALRYSGALAADFHRTLLEGGIYLYPEDTERPQGRIRLLYEAAPLALLAEAAGGRASTGRRRILDVVATDYHQRTPLYIGSVEEVGWAERCHREVPA